MAHRNDVALSNEDVSFAEADLAADDLRRPRHNKERVAIALQLGILMGLRRVLDRQGMKIELQLDPIEQLRTRLEQADPDDMAFLSGPLVGFLNGISAMRRPSA